MEKATNRICEIKEGRRTLLPVILGIMGLVGMGIGVQWGSGCHYAQQTDLFFFLRRERIA